VHAGADWDWQLAGVTVPAILVAAAAVAATRGEEIPSRSMIRPVAVGAACAVGVLAFFVVLGNVPLTQAGSAADAADWSRSARQAHKATRWLPWSGEPWRLIGEAELARQQKPAAAADLRKALAKEPDNWQLWFDLSAATTGAESRRALAHAARLNPLSPEIVEFRRAP
jgi:hypothetical protein